MNQPSAKYAEAQRRISRKIKLNILSKLQEDQTTHNTIISRPSLRNNTIQSNNTTFSSIKIPLKNRQQHNRYSSSINNTDITTRLSIVNNNDQYQTIPLRKQTISSFSPIKHPYEDTTTNQIGNYEYNNSNCNTYNNEILSIILPTDISSHQAKIEKMRMRRRLKKQPLSVALVSKTSLFIQQQPRTSLNSHCTFSNNNSPQRKQYSYFKRNTRSNNKPLSSKVSMRLKATSTSQPKSRKREINNRLLTLNLTNNKEDKGKSSDKNKDKDKEVDLYSIIRKIHQDNRKEIEKSNKSIFKKLRVDIKTKEEQVKHLLDDLQRIRLNNDNELKRKFIIKKEKKL